MSISLRLYTWRGLLTGEYLASPNSALPGAGAAVDAYVSRVYSETAVAYATGAVCRAAARP
jgi:hypothetical protein